MECSCTVDVDYTGDGPVCHKTGIRTARKKHRCIECGKTIIPGEKYEHVWGVWDSEPSTYKTCLDCKSLRDVFFDGFSYTQVWDDFYNEFESITNFYDEFRSITPDIPESCISALTPGARAKVCELIENSWDCN
jgi:hypothetical protein